MKLAELFEATNDKAPPQIELRDVIKYFPSGYAKAISQLWGKDRLVYHGMPFFAGGKLGEAYERSTDVVDHVVKEEDFTVSLHFPLKDSADLGMNDFEYDAHIDDVQEVYLGYNPENDDLYLGVDAWLSEDDFNEAWDTQFKKATGKEYDEEEEDHSDLFHEAWQQYTSMKGYGILFQLDIADEHFNRAEVVVESQGGFYGGVRKLPAFKALKLVDIRLD